MVVLRRVAMTCGPEPVRSWCRSSSKTTSRTQWVGFPGAAQVLQVRRTHTLEGHTTTEVVYAICSLGLIAASPATIATWIQGHWSIEVRHEVAL